MTDETQPAAAQAVIITDINLPFWTCVWLLVRLALASVPALLILAVVAAAFYGVLGAFVGR